MYHYIGAKEILKQVDITKIGKIISSQSDVKNWIIETNQTCNVNNEIIATFVIDLCENLRINDRRSEHIVCANGENILSAGEITFQIKHNQIISISQITNLSTGYCPSIKSWYFVEKALSKITIEFPPFFTTKFIFRICENCGDINLIKDSFFVCINCEKELNEYE
jgi:hypothetical protein